MTLIETRFGDSSHRCEQDEEKKQIEKNQFERTNEKAQVVH